MNSVVLIGTVKLDPMVKFVGEGGKMKTSLLLSVEKGIDGHGSGTMDVRIEAWDKTAEFIGDHVKAGSLIGITGRIDVQRWRDKDTGAWKEATVVVAKQARFIGPPGSGAAPQPARQPNQANLDQELAPEDADAIPF